MTVVMCDCPPLPPISVVLCLSAFVRRWIFDRSSGQMFSACHRGFSDYYIGRCACVERPFEWCVAHMPLGTFSCGQPCICFFVWRLRVPCCMCLAVGRACFWGSPRLIFFGLPGGRLSSSAADSTACWPHTFAYCFLLFWLNFSFLVAVRGCCLQFNHCWVTAVRCSEWRVQGSSPHITEPLDVLSASSKTT